MLSETSIDASRLLAWFKVALTNRCRQLGLAPLPVRYGQTSPRHGGEFVWRTMEFVIHPGLSERLARHPPTARAWYLVDLVAHEAHHYRQYMHPSTRPLVVNVDPRIEQEAYLVGDQQADNTLRTLTPSEVNPARPTRNNPSLYSAFHGNPPAKLQKVSLKVPKRGERLVAIGRLVDISYMPFGSSKRKGTIYVHQSGDTGEGMLPSNLILATDQKGEHFYLLKAKKGKHPFFDARGLIG